MTDAPLADASLAAGAAGSRDLKTLFEVMYRIRRFEEVVGRLYRAGDIGGFVHSSIGQEACATGVVSALAPGDYLTSTHRGHGHCVARGMEVDRMAAELFGKVDGYCRGKGGSMHIADPSLGVLGANGIVGAGLPIACGAGLAAQLRGSGVAVAFFGEGATTTGSFHESLNLAALWRLPVLFACENNEYVEFTPWSRVSPVERVVELAGAYRMEADEVDGTDVEAVADRASGLVERMRRGEGPFLLEMHAFRYRGHYEGDFQKYRDAAEIDGFAEVDPVAKAARRLVERGEETEAELDELRQRVDAEIDRAFEFAESSPEPGVEEVDLHV